MDTKSHYALLVAINRYPGLSDLAGPENDATEFARWLLDPAGGGLDPAHVIAIKSSDFPPAEDPYDANPADTQVKKALNGWLKQGGQWLDRVGERLYLFFAGHGFTAGSLEDPVLFTARAQLDDRDYIAAMRYARKIAVAGFFDEIVLVMDCCQDVLKATAINEPVWSPPDRQADWRVKMMWAFGAPRGQKAFEQSPVAAVDGGTAAPVHGYFSSVFIEALRDAPADTEGWVTARAVEARFGELWTARYLQDTHYEPPFVAPKDMRLYQRAVPSTRLGAVPVGADAAPQGGLMRGMFEQHPELLRTFEGVKLGTAELGARVRVFDMRNRLVVPDLSSGSVHLKPGDYMARVRVGSTVRDRALRVETRMAKVALPGGGGGPGLVPLPQPEPFVLPSMDFASPMPAAWSTTHREFQMRPAAAAIARAVPTNSTEAPATVLVFARDSACAGGNWRMSEALRSGLRLRRLLSDGSTLLPVPISIVVDRDCGFSTFVQHLSDGTYLLGAKRRLRERWVWDEMVLHVAAGWRTEVWIDSIDDSQDGSRFDLELASVRVAPRHSTDGLDAESARQTELLREALADDMRSPSSAGLFGNQVTLPEDLTDLGPMGVMFATALMMRANLPNLESVQRALAWLGMAWSADSADVAALRHACGKALPAPHEPDVPVLAANAVPMLACSWSLLADAPGQTALSVSVQQSVGWWRTASSLWVTTQRSDDADKSESDRAAVSGAASLGALLALDGELPDLKRIAAAIGRPFPALSPLHQTLRAALLDACDDNEPDALLAVIDRVAAEADLSQAVVRSAVADLRRAAEARLNTSSWRA